MEVKSHASSAHDAAEDKEDTTDIAAQI